MAICYTGEEPLGEKKITIEDLIMSADPEDDFEIIAGETFDYRLVKVKVRFNNRKIFKNKTLWFYIDIEDEKSILAGPDFFRANKTLNLKRAKGFRKTHIESYIIHMNDIDEARVLKYQVLEPVHAFALKNYFSIKKNFAKRSHISRNKDYDHENNIWVIEAKYLQHFINTTYNTTMKKEVLQWIAPLVQDEKKPEEDE